MSASDTVVRLNLHNVIVLDFLLFMSRDEAFLSTCLMQLHTKLLLVVEAVIMNQ